MLAIIIVAVFVPIDITYMKHILNNYINHYDTNLVEYKTVEPVSIEKIIELISDKKEKNVSVIKKLTSFQTRKMFTIIIIINLQKTKN